MKGVKWKSFAKFAIGLMSLFVPFVINSVSTNSVSAADYNAQVTYFGSSGWYGHCGSYQCGDWNLDGGAQNSTRRFTPYYNNTDGGVIYVSKLQLWVDPPSGVSIQGKTGFSTEVHINIYNTQSSGWPAWSCGNSDLWKGFSLTTTNNVSVNTNVSSYSCTKTSNPNIMRLKAKILVTPAGGGAFGSTFPAFNMRWDGDKNNSIFVISNINDESRVQADALTFGENVNYVNFQTFTSADSTYLQEIISTQQETNNLLQEQNERDQQDRDNIEQAVDDADSAGDSSQAQAESTGTTLLKGFTDFVSALTSASASNCVIRFDIMGHINGGDVDLCQLSLPAPLQVISSLILIGFCVPLSIATAKKVIALFRSFQS